MESIIIDPEFKLIIPPLLSDEFNGLKESISNEGCRDPIVLWNGIIIDGHNRFQICNELGSSYKTVDYSNRLKSRNDVIDWMYTNQLSRRNLTSDQSSMLRGEQYTFRKKVWGGNRGNQYTVVPSGNSYHLPKTAEMVAKEQNVSERTVRNDAAYASAVNTIVKNVGIDSIKEKIGRGEIKSARKDIIELAKKPISDQKDIIEKVISKPKGDIKSALKENNLKVHREELAKKADETSKLPENVFLHHANFLTDYKLISPESINCIITDPPYVKEWLDNYSAFAEAASYVLKPGGFLVTYLGHIHMDKVLAQMTPYLDYFWIAMLKHAGTTKAVDSRSVQCGMKPILIFNKAPRMKPKRYFNDVIIGTGKEKGAHEWQQGEEELRQIFEPFTDPGDTILDPFMGSGTTIAMAKKLNRIAIGFDIDEQNVAIVKGRMM